MSKKSKVVLDIEMVTIVHSRHSFVFVEDVDFGIFECDPKICQKTVEVLMARFRGIQFACGTMIIGNHDVKVARLMTKSDIAGHAIHAIEPFGIGQSRSKKKFAVIRMKPSVLPDELKGILNTLIELIVSKEQKLLYRENRNSPTSTNWQGGSHGEFSYQY